MSDILASAISEAAGAWSRARSEEARYSYLASKRNAADDFPQQTEITLPGIDLINKTERAELEDGEHVLVSVQKQHIEKKYVAPVPPTPEEIAAERSYKIKIAKIWGSVAAVGTVVLGVVILAERRKEVKPSSVSTSEIHE